MPLNTHLVKSWTYKKIHTNLLIPFYYYLLVSWIGNVGVWCGLCCMLVGKKNAQGKFNPIKSRTIHPTYHKTLSSPSSTFFTMTASLESF